MKTSSIPKGKITFVSWHNYLDQSNGASISTRELLLELARRGWDVSTLCAFSQDRTSPYSLEQILNEHGLRLILRKTQNRFDLGSFNDHGIRSIVFVPHERETAFPTSQSGANFLSLVGPILERYEPDLFFTYGGYELARPLTKLASEFGSQVCFFLHNFAYKNIEYAKKIFVPSNCAANVYRKRLGVDVKSIPPLIRPFTRNVDNNVSDLERKYCVFVNPEISKGFSIFVSLARAASSLFPDIRFLLVEGRENLEIIKRRCAPFLQGVKNVDFMHSTTNPQDFYKLARVLLAPSINPETFCRVAAEALMNGTPVLASDRGALPEVIGDGGVIVSPPSSLAETTVRLLTNEELEPWLASLRRLWYDRDFYDSLREKGLARARNWEYSHVANLYEQEFLSLL